MLRDLATCPECGGTVRRSGGCDVTLKDEEASAAKASRSLRDLDQSLKRLGRTINSYLLVHRLRHVRPD
jgi:hypothetical protein